MTVISHYSLMTNKLDNRKFPFRKFNYNTNTNILILTLNGSRKLLILVTGQNDHLSMDY